MAFPTMCVPRAAGRYVTRQACSHHMLRTHCHGADEIAMVLVPPPFGAVTRWLMIFNRAAQT